MVGGEYLVIGVKVIGPGPALTKVGAKISSPIAAAEVPNSSALDPTLIPYPSADSTWARGGSPVPVAVRVAKPYSDTGGGGVDPGETLTDIDAGRTPGVTVAAGVKSTGITSDAPANRVLGSDGLPVADRWKAPADGPEKDTSLTVTGPGPGFLRVTALVSPVVPRTAEKTISGDDQSGLPPSGMLSTTKDAVAVWVPATPKSRVAVMVWLPSEKAEVTQGLAAIAEPPRRSHGATRSVCNADPSLEGLSTQKRTVTSPELFGTKT